jgi:hypothetical protein
MHGGHWQRFLTVAGMVGVVTAVLAGSAAGLLAAIAADHSLVAVQAAGAVVAVARIGRADAPSAVGIEASPRGAAVL